MEQATFVADRRDDTARLLSAQHVRCTTPPRMLENTFPSYGKRMCRRILINKRRAAVRCGAISFAADATPTRTGTESTYESDDDRKVEERIGGNAQFVVILVTVRVVDSE